jgi:Ca-activated chloride channel family protein
MTIPILGGRPVLRDHGADAGPWANDHRLVLIGLQGRRIDARELPSSNLVFLLDVSGSMASPDKLPLVQRAFRLPGRAA